MVFVYAAFLRFVERMSKMIRLAIKYIKFFKKQTFYVLFSVTIAVMILSAINVVIATDKKISLEESREFYGDYHYLYHIMEKDVHKIDGLIDKCHIDRVSFCRIGDYFETPSIAMELVQADDDWLDMTGSGIVQGKYPEKKGEIALEEWVLDYYGDKKIGDEIKIVDEQEKETQCFILTGILKDRGYSKGVGAKAGFISKYDLNSDGSVRAYIKFDEKTDLRENNKQFSEIMKSEAKNYNWNVIEKVDFKYSNLTYEDAFSDEGDGFVFVEWVAGSGIAGRLGTVAITLFAMIIIYSIFRISVQQRIQEFGKLEAFGLEIKSIILLLGIELFTLFLIAAPIGCLFGVLLSKGIYILYSRIGTLDFSAEYLTINFGDMVFSGMIFLLSLSMILILVANYLRRLTIMETIKGQSRQNGKLRKSCAWSKKTSFIMPIVLLKYFGQRKVRVIIMLFMLSLGGAVFLTGNYIEEEISRNNKLTMQADNGTNADIQIQTETLTLEGIIPTEVVEKVRNIKQVNSVQPVSSYLGSISIKKSKIRNGITEEFWTNADKQDKRITSIFGGSMENEKESFALKTEIYGYEDEMLRDLQDYLIEGDISSVSHEDTIILGTVLNGVMDNIFDLHVGDKITLRYPRENPGDFNGGDSYDILHMKPEGKLQDAYAEKTFVIGGIVKMGIVHDEYLFNSLYGIPQIIMPNQHFRKIFDVKGYNMVSVQLNEHKDSKRVTRTIRDIINDIPHLGVIDFTAEIIHQSDILEQKMVLVHSIVMLLLLVGFFNVLSSINYILMERRREFAIMRAIGITDVKLMRSLIGEGVLYGIIISIIMIVFTLLLQVPVKYVLDHGFAFMNARYNFNVRLAFGMSVVNIVISVVAIIFPAKLILYNEIKDELQEMG